MKSCTGGLISRSCCLSALLTKLFGIPLIHSLFSPTFSSSYFTLFPTLPHTCNCPLYPPSISHVPFSTSSLQHLCISPSPFLPSHTIYLDHSSLQVSLLHQQGHCCAFQKQQHHLFVGSSLHFVILHSPRLDG